MSCEGGCLYGPGVISNPKISERKLKEYSQCNCNNNET